MTENLLQPGTIVADKYRIVRPLGQGGMGTVYLVQHVKTDERLAMKVLNAAVVNSPAARERFRREARTPARIDSDHVARVVDSDIASALGDAPFIVMEYLKGRDLQALSDEAGPLPPKEVITYLRQTARALDKAHRMGIVHRDLKPENLFLVKRDDG
ncbi:MAG TPA: serine/threonine protein kinase, partial [Sorangium sp.]|nr:serine/threonine protein kinase [Sorangium sp.]